MEVQLDPNARRDKKSGDNLPGVVPLVLHHFDFRLVALAAVSHVKRVDHVAHSNHNWCIITSAHQDGASS